VDDRAPQRALRGGETGGGVWAIAGAIAFASTTNHVWILTVILFFFLLKI
jgi:hypothetical protein